MEFDFWFKRGTTGYQPADLSDMFPPKWVFSDAPLVLCESQDEKDFLEGIQLIYGGELDIRIIEPRSSMNPWVYNKNCCFYTFYPMKDW